jgi:ribokinase
MTASIVVIGGINMDLFMEASRFPRPGETFEGRHFSTGGGGKGANQAVAAARVSASPGAVEMVGQVGDDLFGAELLRSLRGYGVGVAGIAVARGQASGVALILSDDSKQNCVLPVYGANSTCGDAQVQSAARLLEHASVLLVQQEISVDVTFRCMKAARARDVTVVLDPAPVRDVPDGFLELADIVHPNQIEAEALSGIEVRDVATAARAAAAIRKRGGRTVIVKLGPLGCYVDSVSFAGHMPTYQVKVVATVGAGDAFAGGLAVGLVEGMPLRDAVVVANAAGALCVSKPGAQDSMPTRAEVDALVRGVSGRARGPVRSGRGAPGPRR